MEPKEYGYIRVSTKEQNIDRQITALKDSEMCIRDRGKPAVFTIGT